MAEFRDPGVTGAIVEIREGRDYLLPLLRGLKDFPGCEAKPLVIVLDPGHGGREHGALFEELKESDLVLDISLRVRRILRRRLPASP